MPVATFEGPLSVTAGSLGTKYSLVDYDSTCTYTPNPVTAGRWYLAASWLFYDAPTTPGTYTLGVTASKARPPEKGGGVETNYFSLAVKVTSASTGGTTNLALFTGPTTVVVNSSNVYPLTNYDSTFRYTPDPVTAGGWSVYAGKMTYVAPSTPGTYTVGVVASKSSETYNHSMTINVVASTTGTDPGTGTGPGTGSGTPETSVTTTTVVGQTTFKIKNTIVDGCIQITPPRFIEPVDRVKLKVQVSTNSDFTALTLDINQVYSTTEVYGADLSFIVPLPAAGVRVVYYARASWAEYIEYKDILNNTIVESPINWGDVKIVEIIGK